eukprot:31404-Pelagococcus_subviridis.AAC.8
MAASVSRAAAAVLLPRRARPRRRDDAVVARRRRRARGAVFAAADADADAASSPSSSHQHHHRRGEDEEESDPWNKTPIAMDARLYAYLLKHTREPEVLRALRVETAALRGSQMQVPPEQGALLFTLCAMLRATHVVEIGTFTGYSSGAFLHWFPYDRVGVVNADP